MQSASLYHTKYRKIRIALQIKHEFYTVERGIQRK